MHILDTQEARLALSLALGLLIGVERERKYKDGEPRGIAGLRTFGLTAFLGGLCAYLALPYAVLVGVSVVAVMVTAGYVLDASRDRGLTTEIALVVVFLLGALALSRPEVAAACTLVMALLLSLKTKMHAFVRETLTEQEMHDGLLVLVSAFVLLPLAPDVDTGPFGAINPQRIARVVLVVLSIGAAGYVAQRVLGKRYGLLVSGLGAGFVSSSATIASMGLRAKAEPSSRTAAVAGALASCIATVVLYGVIAATVDKTLLPSLRLTLGLPLLTAVLASLAFARATKVTAEAPEKGRAFQWVPSLLVGLAAAVLAVVGAALDERVGRAGTVIVSAVAGFVDAHATTASIATLHHAGRIGSHEAGIAIVAALSSNSITKIVMASLSRDVGYALRVSAGVVAIAASAWLGLSLS